jgi:hypothetical protein
MSVRIATTNMYQLLSDASTYVFEMYVQPISEKTAPTDLFVMIRFVKRFVYRECV